MSRVFGKTYDQLLSAMPAAEERPGNINRTFVPHYTLHVELENVATLIAFKQTEFTTAKNWVI